MRSGRTPGSRRGWFVATGFPWTGSAPANRAGAPPPPALAALAAARQALTTIGVPSDLARLVGVDTDAGTRTVEVDPVIGATAVRYLRWSVVVGPDGGIESVSGFLTDAVDAGPVPLETSTATAHALATPRDAMVALDGQDGLALWAVTVGTNMMGYTPAFGSSVKYVLLGSDACDPFDGQGAGPHAQTSLGFVGPNGGCFFRAPTMIHVRRAVRTAGVLTVGQHAGFLVPSYRLSVRLGPRASDQPRTTTIVISAVDRATLTRLARNGS